MGKSRHDPGQAKKKVVTPGTSPHVQIKEGEILTDVEKKEWRVGKAVGVGSFGVIYLVTNNVTKAVPPNTVNTVKIEPHKSGPLFVERNFYIRVGKWDMIEKWKTERDMKHLGMPHYIMFGSHLYQGEKFRFLVLQRFGQDIEKIFTKFKRMFHIKTVLTLGIQILDILEYIHSHGYIHADLKGSNLLLGHGKGGEDRVYLLDYGLACRYVDGCGQHKDYNPDQRKAHDGTLEFTSRDAHVGAHSRRGDLEILGYNMVQWLAGRLPWEDETDPELVAQEKNNAIDNISMFLKSCFGDNEAPAVLNHYLKYIASLQFETKPDYDYCKVLLSLGIRQAGYADDRKLSLYTAPARLLKKRRIDDAENWPTPKHLKTAGPRKGACRRPCEPTQICNRMTRQQTAATSVFELRSREPFDWVKVLQSNPDKMFPWKRIKEVRKKRMKKKTAINDVDCVNLTKEKDDPWRNPTPAMTEVVKMRNKAAAAAATACPGKRPRSDSHSGHSNSPVFYLESILTPAMEEVIRRREVLQRLQQELSFRPIETAVQSRAKRVAVPAGLSQGSRLRKTSAPVHTKPIVRPQTRKYSLPESTRDDRRKPRMPRKSKCLPTSPKTPKRRKLPPKAKHRREVSPSEVDFVPRLRSGNHHPDDLPYLGKQAVVAPVGAARPIRSYVASACGGGQASHLAGLGPMSLRPLRDALSLF